MKNKEELEKIADKATLFKDTAKLLNYVETVQDYLDLFVLLDDNEKSEVMKSELFLKQGVTLKRRAIESITDNKVKYYLIKNGYIKEIVDDSWFVKNMLKDLPEDMILDIIKDGVSIEKLEISSFDVSRIIDGMSSSSIESLLQTPELLKTIGISDYDIPGLISKVSDDKSKELIMSKYELKEYERIKILTSFSTEYKLNILREDSNIDTEGIKTIIGSLNTEEKIDFMKNNLSFMQEKDISVFDIVRRMNKEEQIEFVKNMSELELDEKQTRLIIAGLSNDTKDEIDKELVDEKYREILELRLDDGKSDFKKLGTIIPDLTGDITKYEGLGKIMYLNPLDLDENERSKLPELIKLCPDLRIHDNIDLESSTAKEFIEGEEWINSVIQKIDPNWTDIQKMAFIDTEIGKKISYSPDFDTEVEDAGAERALWKIISSGYGVCNGISQVEQYMLARVGIESEMIGTGTHAFLKVNGIEIPTKDGIVRGDTLVDPTWNLASSRYGGRPAHFCNSYEEIRKADIGADGRDHNCHKSEKLENLELIHMDEATLREVYKSIGIADERGNFPITQTMEEIKRINESTTDVRENINKKIELLKRTCPEYAECICSTDKLLSGLFFENTENFNYDRCIVSRVYDKTDETRRPVLYTYLEFEKEGKIFFYADKESGEFVELSKEEFEKKFDCYDRDLEKNDGQRTWETEKKVEKDLARSSGEIEASQKRMKEDEDIEI